MKETRIIIEHSATYRAGLLFLAALLLACSWLSEPAESNFQLTNEVVILTNEAVIAAVSATETAKVATLALIPTQVPATPNSTQTDASKATQSPVTLPTHPFPFKLSDDGIVYETYPFSSDCAWLGIAGEVRDQEGKHIPGIAVVLNGGGLQNLVAQSGDKPEFGESGWEHFIDNEVKEDNFEIQLWNKMYASSAEYEPVSEKVLVRTRADCRANMIYLVFEIAWDDYVVP